MHERLTAKGWEKKWKDWFGGKATAGERVGGASRGQEGGAEEEEGAEDDAEEEEAQLAEQQSGFPSPLLNYAHHLISFSYGASKHSPRKEEEAVRAGPSLDCYHRRQNRGAPAPPPPPVLPPRRSSFLLQAIRPSHTSPKTDNTAPII